MADIRINALATTATTPASDDFLALDGTAQGTRKILATNIANNVTDVVFGTSGPSAKSSIAARAARQGLVFDGTAGVSANIGTIGSSAVSFGGRCTIPASGTNVLFAISASATTPAQAKAIAIYTFGTSLYVQLNAALGNYLLGEVSGFVTTYAGKVVDILAVRSTSGNIALYVNGVATSPSFTSVGGSAPANWQADIDGPYALLGITSISAWVAGTFYPPVCYNRALTAAEVVSLYEAGVPSGADYNTASNTTFVTGFTQSGSITSFTANATSWSGTGTAYAEIYPTGAITSLTVGKRYRLVVGTVTGTISATGGVSGSALTSNTTYDFTATGTSVVFSTSTVGAIGITGISLTRLGLLLAPDAAQAGGGLTWYDTSGNAANITLPASGVSWNVPTSGYWGGNLTVSGGTITGGTSGLSLASGGTNQNLSITPSGTGRVHIAKPAGQDSYIELAGNGNTAGTSSVVIGQSGADLGVLYNRKNAALSFGTNGTETARFFANGNLFVGASPVDGGQKLQVNGTALLGSNNASFGAYFDYDVGVPGSATLWLKQTTKSASTYTLSGGGTYTALNAPSGGTLYLRIANGDGLTITATGATFAGNITVSGTDKSILLNGASTAFSREIDVRIAGDTEGRLLIRGGGSLLFGDGAGTFDSAIARSSASMLTVTGNLTTTGAIAIGNTVNTVSPTSPNRTITMVIGGVTYYLHAKTTND